MSTLTNVFEDDSTIREGGWLKVVRQCERIPDDYGVAWYRPNEAVAICAPIPFHTLFGWAYRAYWFWRVKWGCQAATLIQRAHEQGMADERARSDRYLFDIHKRHERELRLRVDEADRRGRQAVLQELKNIFDEERGETRH